MKETCRDETIVSLLTRIPIAIVMLLIISACGREPLHVGFAYYNVENLFDTIDHPDINDNSHLPGSDIPWNTERYNTKLDNLARVMSSIDSVAGFPALFGLCEVENYEVLKDLVNHQALKKANYQIIHRDSPDERGIDVALLYRKTYFTPLRTNFIRVTFPFDREGKTRDILYAKGLAAGKDTLHIFINHWTSRWGGRDETEEKRRYTGRLLRHVSDSILALNPQAAIIIAGDLNDNPTDLSVAEDLGALAVTANIIPGNLYNLSLEGYQSGKGTLYYRSWDMFDQVIVSGSLLQKASDMQVKSPDQQVIGHDWMLYQPSDGPARPNRTSAREYYGGYSDHLPVYIGLSVY